MGASEFQVRLSCQCGASLLVRSQDAGNDISCSCGRSIAVPSLSRLRTLAGVEAYTTNPAEAIRDAQYRGEDPAGKLCIICQSPHPTYYRCHAVCESLYTKHVDDDQSDDIPTLLAMLFFPRLLFRLFGRRMPAQVMEFGHDVQVSFLLPVCGPCASSGSNPTKLSVAKKLMRNVPLYSDLLNYYPELKLSVEPETA